MDASNCKTWVRPKSVPFPSVWKRYVGQKNMPDGKIPTFIIQDVPDDRHDDLIDFMTTNFFRDEYICSNQNMREDLVSIKEFHEEWRKILKQRVVLVALVDDEGTGSRPRIAGANMTAVTFKTDNISHQAFKGRGIRNLIKFAYEVPTSTIDVFERYGINEYMSALGLCVHPDFRGQGLSRAILGSRYDICKAVGLKVTVSVFTPVAAQRAAASVGMELLYELPYEDCKEDGKLVFHNMKSKSMKLMGRVIE